MDALQTRFSRVQDLQNDFLNRIKQFRVTSDPSVLPDVSDADRLDDELEDIARELSQPGRDDELVASVVPGESSSKSIRRGRSRFMPVPVATVIAPPVPLAVTSDVLESAPIDIELIDAPQSKAEPSAKTRKDSVDLSPAGRRRRVHSFFTVGEASSLLNQNPAPHPPVASSDPTFSAVMKEALASDLLTGDAESSAPDTFDEPPPTGRDLSLSPPLDELAVMDEEARTAEEHPVEQTVVSSPTQLDVPAVISSPTHEKDELEVPVVRQVYVPQPEYDEHHQTAVGIVPSFGHGSDLTYASPTPPTSPPKEAPSVLGSFFSVPSFLRSDANVHSPSVSEKPVIVPDVPETPSGPLVDDQQRPSQRMVSVEPTEIPKGRIVWAEPLTTSPLRILADTNERRKNHADRFWKHVRAERLREERLIATLGQLEAMSASLDAEFKPVRVKTFVTGEYLYRRKSLGPSADPVGDFNWASPGRARSRSGDKRPPIPPSVVISPSKSASVGHSSSSSPKLPTPYDRRSPKEEVAEAEPALGSEAVGAVVGYLGALLGVGPAIATSPEAHLPDPISRVNETADEVPTRVETPQSVHSRSASTPLVEHSTPLESVALPEVPTPVEASTPEMNPSEVPLETEETSPRRKRSDLFWAVLTIQKWFREWSRRRKEKLADIASFAEVEAVRSRDALRRRRRERSGSSPRNAADWITHLAAPVPAGIVPS